MGPGRRDLCWSRAGNRWHSPAMNLTFESARLRYQPLTVDDIDLAIQQWTDPEVIKYVADRTYSVEELEEEIPIYCRRCGDGSMRIRKTRSFWSG